MRTTYASLLVISLFLSCGSPSWAAGADSRKVIVVLGSSTAAGTGASVPDSSWVARFRRAAKERDSTVQVVNLAVGGYTTFHVMPTGYRPRRGRPKPDPAHNITRGLKFRPGCIIFNLPSNDAAGGFRVSESLANYDSVLARIPRGIRVWVTTTQPRDLDSLGRARLTALRDSTYARFGEHALDFWSGLANPDGSLKTEFDAGDGIHLNDKGHRILAERAARVISACLSRP
ncbi:MAG TPA: SGNH/GDSL hydrolase family protein [Bacteroidota bacterium]